MEMNQTATALFTRVQGKGGDHASDEWVLIVRVGSVVEHVVLGGNRELPDRNAAFAKAVSLYGGNTDLSRVRPTLEIVK